MAARDGRRLAGEVPSGDPQQKGPALVSTSTGPRVLFWDIETAPMLAWVWSRWQDSVTAVEAEWYALAVS